MATRLLLEGHLDIWKNGYAQSSGQVALLHDLDLNLFKLVSMGNIILTFRANEVTGWGGQVKGMLSKRQVSSIQVKFSSGDEYNLMFKSPDMESYDRVRQAIDSVLRRDLARAEVLRELKLKERVSVLEVCKILARFKIPDTFDDGQNAIESLIASSKVEGRFDGKEFVSKAALDRESVHYEIVAKFELDKNGVVVFKCPSCGASLTLEEKSSPGKCKYCGGSFVIPGKILDLVK